MIIFDLDGTLADCEHRRHLVDPNYDKSLKEVRPAVASNEMPFGWYMQNNIPWIPNWQAFYEACAKDEPIKYTIDLLRILWIKEGEEIEIWSGRCESVRKKTEHWLHICLGLIEKPKLKMRPIGDNTPLHELKERWLNEYGQNSGKYGQIDFVFDSDPASVDMFRRRGIFVFDCNQGN